MGKIYHRLTIGEVTYLKELNIYTQLFVKKVYYILMLIHKVKKTWYGL